MGDNVIDYEKLADMIAARLKNDLDAEIWDGELCAKYLHVSKTYFINSISKIYGFPRPINIPVSGCYRSQPRWLSADVKAWIAQQKKAS